MGKTTSAAGETQGKGKRGANLPAAGMATRFKPNDPATGYKDERINRKGTLKPRGLRELENMLDMIFDEELEVKDNSGDDVKQTELYGMLKRMMRSRDMRGPMEILNRRFGKVADSLQILGNGADSNQPVTIPAHLIAPDFVGSHRAILSGNYAEFVEYGGRGTTKSSFVSLEFITLLVNNPLIHGLATRQVKDTLRDSVYAQLVWAISELGLTDSFKCITSPLEIEYLPTGQKIYFRGADDPAKIKSIKPQFGYIGLVWFEELDQFKGAESIRKIEQSVRGGDITYIFKTFNPPPTKNNWANKYVLIPKANQYKHFSNYLGIPESYLLDKEIRKALPLEKAIELYKDFSVPREWLGKVWLEEAEHLQQVNFTAFENEHLGLANNEGGSIFNNVVIREIADSEIEQFDNIKHGLDWGYYPAPASFGKMHYDSARRVLYIFAEGIYYKKSNQALFNQLVADKLIRKIEYKERGKTLVSYPDRIIADSAEPKSVGDFKAYGASIIGAEKGPESRNYSYKWLQGLTRIVIDQKRAPHHADQFLNAEYPRNKDGEVITEYPEENDDSIDDTRYALNLIWRRKGE